MVAHTFYSFTAFEERTIGNQYELLSKLTGIALAIIKYSCKITA